MLSSVTHPEWTTNERRFQFDEPIYIAAFVAHTGESVWDLLPMYTARLPIELSKDCAYLSPIEAGVPVVEADFVQAC
jgi:hypothetical protein